VEDVWGKGVVTLLFGLGGLFGCGEKEEDKGDIGGCFFRSERNNGRKMMDRRLLQKSPSWGGEAG
jgi:hypothetical protein